jgi:6-phosphofructokinase 1
VPIATLLEQRKSVDVSALYDPRTYRASLVGIEGMPMLLY